MKTIQYTLQDGIASITFDEPNSPVNTMCLQWQDDLSEATAQVLKGKDAIKGVILASGKSTFFAGADLKAVMRLTPVDAIAIIRRAGGVPVLAHPGLANRDAMIPDLATAGLMGIEVYYAEHSAGQIERYLEMCRTLDLVATGGSDYHGPQSGRTNPPGTPNVPWSAWEQLQRVAEQARRGATPSLPRSQPRSASD